MRVYKNLCPATISASIIVANVWKKSLKNVESDFIRNRSQFFFTAKRYLLSK